MKNKLLFASFIATAFLLGAVPVFAQKKSTTLDIRSAYTTTDESTLHFSSDGHQYRAKLTRDNRITELYRDDVKIAPEDYGKYESVIKEVLAELEKQREEAAKQRVIAEKMREEAAVHRKEAEKMREEASVQRAQAEQQREKAEVQRKEAAKQRAAADEQRAAADKMREEAEQHRKKADEFRAQAEVQRIEAGKQREKAAKDRETMNNMLDEIVAEKIISSRDDLKEMVLDEAGLIVNGVQQSDKLHKQFKAKYLKGKRIRYQQGENFRGITVD